MIENLFSIPIYKSKVDQKKFNTIQLEIAKGIKNTQFKMNEKWGNTHYLSDIKFRDNFLVKHQCLTFLEELHTNHLPNYLPSVKCSNNRHVVQSWAALFRKHNYGHIHGHHGSIAGVYYYKTKGSTGNLFFTNIYDYQKRVNIYGEEGDLLLFPTHLKHGITTNTSDIERISISFNLN